MRERQQVGQVGDRQQERGRVGHPQAGVGAGLGGHRAGQAGCEHDRRQQDHGRVEAEHRGDDGREHEDPGEQQRRLPTAPAPHALRGRGEEPGSGTDVGDHEDRHQEGHHRRQAGEGCAHLGRGQQTGRQRDAGTEPGRRAPRPVPTGARTPPPACRRGRARRRRPRGVARAQPRCTCEDGPVAGQARKRTSVSEQPGRYQRSPSGMVGALIVTVLVILGLRGASAPASAPTPR